MRRKILMGVLAIAVPAGTLLIAQGAAIAGGVTGSGTTTCSFGGTINFSPPLSATGTAGAKDEVTTVNATFHGCTGGTPVGSASSVSVKPIKVKAAKGTNAGTCSSFDSASTTAVVKTKVNWNGEKPSKFNVDGLHAGVNGEDELGFTGSFSVSGSYAGSGTLGVYLTPASSTAIGTCSGSISSLTIDSTTSSASI